jgi:hypothetical protein
MVCLQRFCGTSRRSSAATMHLRRPGRTPLHGTAWCAYAMMLRHQGDALMAAAAGLLVAIVKGPVSFEEMSGESLVHRRLAKQGIFLNETATVIWRLCDGTRSIDAIIAEVAGIAASDIAVDVRDTLDRLVELDAVRFAGPAQAPPSPSAQESIGASGEVRPAQDVTRTD